MKILSIDSSGLVASVAIMEEETMIAEYTVNNKMTHSQTLLPMIDEIFSLTQTDKESLDAIAIAAGPGSFTGLRIGAATAKGLGLALNIPIIRVPTVDALAYNITGFEGLVCPMMDARRKQVYTGLYWCLGDEFKVFKKQCALGVSEIIEDINKENEPVIFLGDGVPVNKEYIEKNIATQYSFAPAHMSRQRAGAVGALALKYAEDPSYPEIRQEAAADFVPEYLRLSQAEREMLEKEGKDGKQD